MAVLLWSIISFSITLTQFVQAAPRTSAQGNPFHGSGCKGKPAEIFFLLDSSSSIWIVDFHKQLKFVSDLLERFDLGPNSTRVGVASFSYRYHENIRLGLYDDVDDIKTAVEAIPHYLGGTYTYDALDGVRTRGLRKEIVREGVTKIVIVLTDGESYNEVKTKAAAMRLKEEAIVFAIGIGDGTDRSELAAIASEPTENFLFEVGNYGLLETIKEKLADKACKAQNDEPKEEPLCSGQKAADIMFLVEPTETGIADSEEIFEFTEDLASDFINLNNNIQVGVESTFCGGGDIRLGEFTDTTQVNAAFKTMRYSGMSQMLRRLRTHSFKEENGGRDRARHMAVLFVDDKLYDSKAVIEEAKRSKHYDVELFVVAIGDSVVDTELASLASNPTDRHVIRVPSYVELRSSKQTILQKLCHGL